MLWHDPAVQAALISAAGTIIGTIVAAVGATIVGKDIMNRDELRRSLAEAQGDVAFLLAVERIYGERHRLDHGIVDKVAVRELARGQGLNWSGRHTPGNINYRK